MYYHVIFIAARKLQDMYYVASLITERSAIDPDFRERS